MPLRPKMQPVYILVAVLAAVTLSAVAQESRTQPNPAVTVKIHADQPGDIISRHIYGHFIEHLGRCVYDGLWVGPDSTIPNTDGVRTDVLEALKALHIPNLRWPGGCFADDYHWRDGVGPMDERPRTVNLHWGHGVEDNSFGTHEFLNLCEKLGAEPYLAANVGSGTPKELRDWVEYVTCDRDTELTRLRKANGREKPWKVRYWGLGNESWGCGGEMTPEYYSDLYRRYSVYAPSFGDNRIVKIACGPSGGDQNWVEVPLRRAGRFMQGLSLHNYTLTNGWSRKQPDTGFGEEGWFPMLRSALDIRGILDRTIETMDKHDERGRIGLFVDEWGVWHNSPLSEEHGRLYQQNTVRDAVIAGLTLNEFNKRSKRIRMANIAQTVNVLQSLILTDGDKMVLTPTYHVFDMYQVHFDAESIPVDYESPEYSYENDAIPALSISASRAEDGSLNLTLCNLHPNNEINVTLDLDGFAAANATGRVMTGDKLDAHNTYDHPDAVAPKNLEGIDLDGGAVKLTLPARSVSVVSLTE